MQAHLRLCLIILILIPAMVSCAHVTPLRDARASFGKVGIYTLPAKEIAFEAPTSGKMMGAGKGALMGAGASVAGGAYADGWGVVLGIVLSPVFSLSGLVYGAVAAEPADKVRTWQEAVDKGVAGIDLVSGLREGILKTARDRGLEVTSVDTVPVVNKLPDYSALDAMGINTLVEAQWLYCGLEGHGIDPEMQFRMSAKVRVIKTKDCSEIYSTDFNYLGPKKTFAHWAGSAFILRKQVGLGVSGISGQVVEQVFFYTTPPRPWYYRLLKQGDEEEARPVRKIE